MKYVKLTAGLIVEIALVLFVIKQKVGVPFTIELSYYAPAIIIIGILISNLASFWIVDFIKNEFLWKRAGAHPEDKNRSLRDWWKEQGLSSEISPFLGVMERIILVVTGIVSFQVFFAACGAWTTIKIAVDWNQFKDMKYRVIGHIYLISTASSLFLASIDVAAVRLFLGMPLI
ncbi:hypothetical protein ACFL0O_06775 [Thermodesulfobacteriota bacterium]